MITGDGKATARAVVDRLNIKEVHYEILPKDKMKVIKKDNYGSVVAMMGEGINDAPALAFADVGIEVSTGTDVAIESGDIILVGGTISKVIDAINV